MSRNLREQESAGLRRLQARWIELPLSYRVNALLYFLGAVFLLYLLSTVASRDDGPRQIQVGAGVVTSTTSGARLTVGPTSRATISTSGPSTSGPTTSVGVSTSSVASSAGSSDTQPQDPTPAPTSPPTAPPTAPPTSPTTAAPTTPVPTVVCRDSPEPRCGTFAWDPAPAADSPLTITVNPRTTAPGGVVSFDVEVVDPDHVVTENCGQIHWGDGAVLELPCTPPPACPPHYGPWTPPGRQEGRFNQTYAHAYNGTGPYTARFTFRSQPTHTCPELDPYASVGSRDVTVSPRAGT